MAAARVLKGLTQRQLAELVGTREIEISRIETGRVTPDAAGRLQQPGPVASGVLIATSRELLSVSAAGEVQSLFGGGGGGGCSGKRPGFGS